MLESPNEFDNRNRLMLSDAYRDPLIGMYYLATLPKRRRVAARQALAGQAPIIALYYHRVADEHPNGWTIGVRRFKAQIEWLRERFEIISLVEAQTRMGSRANHTPAVCITFDDGYAENCDAALPWLIQALKKGGDTNVRYCAIYAVANLGADARDAIPVLEAITDPDMQVHVRYGLQRIRGVDKK